MYVYIPGIYTWYLSIFYTNVFKAWKFYTHKLTTNCCILKTCSHIELTGLIWVIWWSIRSVCEHLNIVSKKCYWQSRHLSSFSSLNWKMSTKYVKDVGKTCASQPIHRGRKTANHSPSFTCLQSMDQSANWIELI